VRTVTQERTQERIQQRTQRRARLELLRRALPRAVLAPLLAPVLVAGLMGGCHRGRVRPVSPVASVTGDSSATAAPPSPGMRPSMRIPRDAARFEIEAVDDSTARFRPFEAKWLRTGMTVYAVDPTKRDALVARLRIVDTDSGRLVARVTGQVTRVTTEHFLLAVRPGTPWYKRGTFWSGLLAGAAVGAGGVLVAR
jgi:hypothetical protein